MAQQLIVEGSDAILLAEICKKRQLSPPKGYSNPQKFKEEFVVQAGGYEKALIAFKEAISNPDISNLGIIVDADEADPVDRWDAMKNILAKLFDTFDFNVFTPSTNGLFIKVPDSLTVGVWIMPDNTKKGYLEHFLSEIIPIQNDLWQDAQSIVNTLEEKEYFNVPPSKIHKSKLYSWLAWQRQPGKSFGTAVKSDLFNLNSPLVNAYLEWFQSVFELENVTK